MPSLVAFPIAVSQKHPVQPESSPRVSQGIKRSQRGVQQARTNAVTAHLTSLSTAAAETEKTSSQTSPACLRVSIESFCPTGSGARSPSQGTPTSWSVSSLSTPTRTRGEPCTSRLGPTSGSKQEGFADNHTKKRPATAPATSYGSPEWEAKRWDHFRPTSFLHCPELQGRAEVTPRRVSGTDTILPGFRMLPSAQLVRRSIRFAPSWICSSSRSFMDLKALLSSLNDFASLSFAESWDNVGLLVEPSPPHTVKTLFLTNDLTEEVMEEALQKKADLILSYHPPIFRAMKHVTWKTWKERLVIRALENRVAIYSPHTAYDAAPQGVNSWLAKGLGTCTARPIHPSKAPNYPTEGAHRLEVSVNHTQDLDKVMSAVKGIGDVSVTSFSARCDDEEHTRISLNCTQKALMQVLAFLSQNRQLYQKTEILSLEKPLLLNTGMGRLCTLDESVSLATMIERIKAHLKLAHLRLALGVGKTLESPVKVVALCAGSGGSVLQGVEADLYLTGEMSHHDVLDAASKGINVILCEHSNTERGFLSDLQEMLGVHLENKINIILSETDRDPLHVV